MHNPHGIRLQPFRLVGFSLLTAGCSILPVPASSYQTMRMEMNDFFAVILSPWAQTKFFHTITAGYATGAAFVLAPPHGTCSKAVTLTSQNAASVLLPAFGFCVHCFAAWQGDESGYLAAQDQPAKLAAMEGMWETEPAPAAMALVAFADPEKQENTFKSKFLISPVFLQPAASIRQFRALKKSSRKTRLRLLAA